ncbi:MAG: 30S ribosomal protein S13 [Candidatus Aenigmarchaeota archaeon]|nr:30S ribosomal protein S13 [Candidatus Aenigmarchaeota archaeon]
MAKQEQKQENLRGIVRIAGTDIKGEKKLFVSLQKIKGVSSFIANFVCRIHNFDRSKKIGSLTIEETKLIEETINNPIKYGLPVWAVNRKSDPETGVNHHLIGSNLVFTHKQDLRKMMDLRNYKGVRHGLGLPVRGQRTRSSFRKGKSVGVVRKKQMPAKTKK